MDGILVGCNWGTPTAEFIAPSTMTLSEIAQRTPIGGDIGYRNLDVLQRDTPWPNVRVKIGLQYTLDELEHLRAVEQSIRARVEKMITQEIDTTYV